LENNHKEKLMYSTLSLSHIDLDGISCQLVIEQCYNNVKNYNCNYDKISEYLEYIDDNCSEFRPDRVFITDLSFEKSYAIQLAHIIKHHSDVKFIYIDHHPYDEELMKIFEKMKDSLPNFVFIHSTKACATKLTYKYLNKICGISHDNIEKYVESVNAYDLWIQNSEYFKAGFVYNELFFDLKLKAYYFELRDLFKLKQKHKDRYVELVGNKNEYFGKLEKSKLTLKNNNQFYIFADSFKSWITLDYPGFDYYVIASTYARISVRISDRISEEDATKVKDFIISNKDMNGVLSMGGHPRAFGITLENGTSIDQLVMHVQDLNKLLDQLN
jgi:oligoribonuclease NrnB/cAMP/cGMP phosphodiesterase (DHH superfamily)